MFSSTVMLWAPSSSSPAGSYKSYILCSVSVNLSAFSPSPWRPSNRFLTQLLVRFSTMNIASGPRRLLHRSRVLLLGDKKSVKKINNLHVLLLYKKQAVTSRSLRRGFSSTGCSTVVVPTLIIDNIFIPCLFYKPFIYVIKEEVRICLVYETACKVHFYSI